MNRKQASFSHIYVNIRLLICSFINYIYKNGVLYNSLNFSKVKFYY